MPRRNGLLRNSEMTTDISNECDHIYTLLANKPHYCIEPFIGLGHSFRPVFLSEHSASSLSCRKTVGYLPMVTLRRSHLKNCRKTERFPEEPVTDYSTKCAQRKLTKEISANYPVCASLVTPDESRNMRNCFLAGRRLLMTPQKHS